MELRGQFSDFFFEAALPAINAKITQTYRAKPKMFDKLLNVESTTRSIEQYSMVTGVGLPQAIGEGEDIATDSQVQGFDKTLKPAKFGLGIACTQELVEDDKFGIVGQRAVALSNSIDQGVEIQAASLFNNAFATVGPDGKVLCAADHPLVKVGGTCSNLLSVPADLDVDSLELALVDWMSMKTHEGFLNMWPTPRLLVAPANHFNAHEILKGNMRSDTANNTINAFKYAEGGPVDQVLTWGQLTDPDAWFLVAPPASTGLIWLWRKDPYTKSDFVEKNETGYVYRRYRAAYGFKNWDGVYGTPGAA